MERGFRDGTAEVPALDNHCRLASLAPQTHAQLLNLVVGQTLLAECVFCFTSAETRATTGSHSTQSKDKLADHYSITVAAMPSPPRLGKFRVIAVVPTDSSRGKCICRVYFRPQ